jgi:hypothetical protein
MLQSEIPLRLNPHGAEQYSAALSNEELTALRSIADSALKGRSGVRVFGQQALIDVLGKEGTLGRVAARLLGEGADPVRAIIFDKTTETNWSVAWHQDRTIAVRARYDAPGFGPWSIKAGVVHVEPPFEVTAGMITIRAHLDDCDVQNGPLMIVPGSHQLGRVPAKQAAEIAGRSGHAICLASAGDIWVYATAIIHASDRARVPHRRRVLHVDYASTNLPNGLEWLGVIR